MRRQLAWLIALQLCAFADGCIPIRMYRVKCRTYTNVAMAQASTVLHVRMMMMHVCAQCCAIDVSHAHLCCLKSEIAVARIVGRRAIQLRA